jgi:glycosyltransferase involved in cell wall biosynthesis
MQISVVVPVCNGESYLDECLSSVLSQNLADFELLIGDDCSSDRSTDIVQSFKDGRVRIFKRNSNIGLFQNLNLMIKQTTSPLLRFLCQDDSLRQDCLAEEVDFLNSNREIAMSFCKTTKVNEKGEVIGQCELGDLPETINSELATRLLFYLGCIPGNLSTVCVRRDVFDQVGLFDESFGVAADYEMWCRVCEAGALGVIHKRLIRLRQHGSQLSRTDHSGVEAIKANRAIRSRLLHQMAESEQSRARRYERLRQTVLEVHYSLRCIQKGRFRYFLEAFKSIGLREFVIGLCCWFATGNNHFFRPRVTLPPAVAAGIKQCNPGMVRSDASN